MESHLANLVYLHLESLVLNLWVSLAGSLAESPTVDHQASLAEILAESRLASLVESHLANLVYLHLESRVSNLWVSLAGSLAGSPTVDHQASLAEILAESRLASLV